MGCENVCGRGCSHGEKPNEEKAGQAGLSLAHDAIDEIRGKTCRGYSCDEVKLGESVDAFIQECTENGVDPLQVVAHVSDKEGVMISGPVPPDKQKRWVYELLRAVVKRIINAFLDSVSETYGLGKVDLAGIAADGTDELPQAVTVRVVPIRIRYA